MGHEKNTLHNRRYAKMKATTLKKKYPNQWENVEASMIGQLRQHMSESDIGAYDAIFRIEVMGAIAHNAAYFACLELHEYIKTQR